MYILQKGRRFAATFLKYFYLATIRKQLKTAMVALFK